MYASGLTKIIVFIVLTLSCVFLLQPLTGLVERTIMSWPEQNLTLLLHLMRRFLCALET